MPIIYSFTTSLDAPTSSDFPCFDVGEASMSNILLLSEVSANRTSPWITFDGNNDMVIFSNDGQATVLNITLPISQKFTFETEFKPSALPVNLDNLQSSRFFLAVFDAQDNAGGVLISKSGLAIVSSFGNTVMPIAGSQNIIDEGDDYYTLRMVVDGLNNVMDLYITKTEDLVLVGHQLRYTTAAPITPSGSPDSCRLEIAGTSVQKTEIKVSTLRCNCTALLIPNKRPIADTGRDQTAVLGSVLSLDGTDSYDPESAVLSYSWALYAAPLGSTYRQSGAAGFTVDDGDGDAFTDLFEETGDPWSVANSPNLQPGDLLIIGEDQYEVSSDDWDWNSATASYDRSGTFDSNQLRVTLDALPIDLSGQAWDLYFASSFFNDRTAPQPSFVPDIEGLYGVQLVVNDGDLDSLPSQGLANIAQSNVAFGYVPDVNFIWDYLSDAWALYEDRDPVTTIWSGFAQIVSNLLLTAWQLDYAKSMVDIQRQFQRRWLDYRTLYEEPVADRDDVSISIIRGPIVSLGIISTLDFGLGLTLLLAKDGGAQVTVDLVGVLTGNEIVTEINAALGEAITTVQTARAQVYAGDGKTYVILEHASLLVVGGEGTANALLGFSEEEDTQNDFRGVDGQIGAASVAFIVGSGNSDPFLDFAASGIVQKGDLLALDGEGYTVVRASAANQLTVKQDLVPTSGEWVLSSSIKSVSSDFTEELVQAGDIAILEIRVSGSFDTVRLLCEVTGAQGDTLGFDPGPLLSHTSGDVSGYDISLFGVQRVSAIPVDALVQKIPRLQEVILDPSAVLTENRDFQIITNANDVRGIRFSDGTYTFDDPPPDILWAEVTYLDNNQMIEDNFGKPVDFLVEHLEEKSEDLDYLSAVRGLWYAFFNGPSLWNVRLGVQILLGLPFAEVDGVIVDISETYSAAQIRVLLQDSADPSVVRSYFIPRNRNFEEDGESMIADDPNTGETYQVGDTVSQFSPLSKGVEILDWINDPEWWSGYQGQGSFLEVDKFFKFLVRADIDVFSLSNLVFAMDFVKRIKPAYTYPLWVVFKRLPGDTISVTDPAELEKIGTLKLVDNPLCAESIVAAGSGGAYRFDDTDESGNPNWAFDGDPLGAPSGLPAFLYDRKELCPGEHLVAFMSADWPGGIFPFDWFWAFDDGGDAMEIPLSGPLASKPPSGGPYGALVGTIQFDTSYAAGWYTASKVL